MTGPRKYNLSRSSLSKVFGLKSTRLLAEQHVILGTGFPLRTYLNCQESIILLLCRRKTWKWPPQ